MADVGKGRVLLVTGAAGFIGYHLTEHLLREGWTVHGIDSLNAYYDPALKRARLDRLEARPAFGFTRLDIADAAAVMALFEALRPHAVVHLAAQAGVRYSLERPDAYVSSNVAGFLSIIEACRHVPVDHLVYASSSSVYGGNARLPFSEHDIADHPVSLYAATKRANELMAHAYASLFGIRATGVRFFTVYGPWGRPDMAYFKFTKAILEGHPIDVYNRGQLSRDLTYIDDVTEALARLVGVPAAASPAFDPERPDPAIAAAPHRIYNIGNNRPVTLDRFIAAIESATGRTAERRLLPMQPGDVPATFANVDDLAEAVGFAPDTLIEDGVARFVKWYRAYYDI